MVDDRFGLVMADALMLALAVLFAVAAATKLRNRASFATTLTGYGVPAGATASRIALTVAVLEACAAATTVIWGTVGVSAVAVLLLVFTAAAARAHHLGSRIACGCFSLAASPRLGIWTYARNFLLLSACAVALGASDAGASWSVPAVIAAGALAGSVLLFEALLEVGERSPADPSIAKGTT